MKRLSQAAEAERACDMALQWDILHRLLHIVLSYVHSVRTSQYSITSKANLTALSNKTCLSLHTRANGNKKGFYSAVCNKSKAALV